MSGKPPKSPGISPMRVKLRDEGESKSSVGRLKKLKRRISASFRQLSLSKESSGSSNCSNKTNDGSIDGIEADQNHLWGLAASHSLNSTPNSKSRQLMSVMGRSLDGILEPGYNGEGLDDGEFDHNHQRSKKYQHIENVAAMSVKRHHSSAGDFIAINNHVVTACRSTTPLRLRPSRPKSEGNLSVQSLRAKRTSSFGCNSPFGKVEVYQKQEQLGKGSYATVYKGFSLLTNSVVALKEIHLEPDEGTPFTAIREASLLKGLKHTNIVTLHDIVHTKNSLTLVFEYLPTDLGQYLEKHKGGLNPHNIKLFLFQLLRGLSFCHDRQILHRDLKPQNLLISESGDLKLADFGLARAKSVPSKTFSDEVVTLWYRPPDLLLGSHDYSTSIDIWGVGCIFIEMVTGVAIFPGVSDVYDQLDRIWQVLGTPTERSWPGVTSFPHYRLDKFGFYASQRLMQSVPKMAHIPYAELLAHGLLQLQPNKRISSHDAMRHPYFGDLPTKIFDLSDAASIFTLPSVQLKPEMDELLRIRPHIRTNPHAAKSSTAQVSKLSYNQHSGPSAV